MTTFIVVSSAICHGNSLLHFGLNIKVSREGLLGGGQIILKHLYLNDYADGVGQENFIYTVFDYHLACEISSVRTLALTRKCSITAK